MNEKFFFREHFLEGLRLRGGKYTVSLNLRLRGKKPRFFLDHNETQTFFRFKVADRTTHIFLG